ncbi:PHO85 cyclin-5 [Pestalotiopsis sp. IQ-011]
MESRNEFRHVKEQSTREIKLPTRDLLQPNQNVRRTPCTASSPQQPPRPSSSRGRRGPSFGNSFYLGPFPDGQAIQKATYSMTAPTVPTGFDSADSSLWLSVWVGMQPGVIYSANECPDASCGTLAAFGWTNMTLTLSAAVDSLEDYLALNVATSSGFSSSDGGLTWQVDEINMGTDTAWS